MLTTGSTCPDRLVGRRAFETWSDLSEEFVQKVGQFAREKFESIRKTRRFLAMAPYSPTKDVVAKPQDNIIRCIRYSVKKGKDEGGDVVIAWYPEACMPMGWSPTDK